jgi:hypothetical protein
MQAPLVMLGDVPETLCDGFVRSRLADFLFLVKLFVALRGVTPGAVRAFCVWKGRTEASGSDYNECP